MIEAEKLPSVYIIVLNYNGLDHLKYAIPSILATRYGNLTVVMVDNDSHDGSMDFLRRNYPSLQLLPLSKNKGWSGGNNAGIKLALENGADYILLANNDILVHPDWVRNAVLVAEADRRIGIVGFKGLSLQRERHLLEASIASPPGLVSEPVDHVVGWAMFVRSQAFRLVGVIDNRYFAFGEETDFEHRVKIAGYSMVSITTPACHYSGGTFSRYPYKAAYLLMRNTLRFYLKYLDLKGIRKFLVRLYNTIRRGHAPGRSENGFFYENSLTPGSRPASIALFGAALLWNFVQLPITIQSGRTDRRRAEDARKELGNG